MELFELKHTTGQRGLYVCFGDGVAIGHSEISGQIVVRRAAGLVLPLASEENGREPDLEEGEELE